MWRTMQAEPSTSVPYMAYDAVKVLIELLFVMQMNNESNCQSFLTALSLKNYA